MSMQIVDKSTGAVTPIPGTTTNSFTGATASADGTKGYVPAPQAGDEEKFLRGDGQWAKNKSSSNFTGSVQQWDALTLEEKDEYETMDFIDDYNGLIIDDVPTADSEHLVKSGGVYSSIRSMAASFSNDKVVLPSLLFRFEGTKVVC